MDQQCVARFRAEARGMAEAYADALMEHAPAGLISGVYIKGSAFKQWETEIDYVPEFSDVDIHIRFADWRRGTDQLGTVRQAARIAETARSTFHRRFPDASHLPRPQLVVVNELESQPTYIPSPAGTVETLSGVPYPEVTRERYRDVGPHDRSRFLADAEFVRAELPWKLIDRPGKDAWRVVSALTWRVGPAGPRLLTQLGVHPFDAWTMNRTSVARELQERAGANISDVYRAFYMAGWDGFRSRFETVEPAVRALNAADLLFSLGRALLDGGG